MAKVLDLNKSIYELSKEYPEILNIMKELGFESITSSTMLNTAGRVMTIPKGASMKGINLDKIKFKFIEQGFVIKDE